MAQEDESQVISLLKDLQKRMTYLEKKIDMLVGQSKEKSSSKRSYSQAPRTYGRSQRYKDKYESCFGARTAQSERPFEKKQSAEDRGFKSVDKKPSVKS